MSGLGKSFALSALIDKIRDADLSAIDQIGIVPDWRATVREIGDATVYHLWSAYRPYGQDTPCLSTREPQEVLAWLDREEWIEDAVEHLSGMNG